MLLLDVARRDGGGRFASLGRFDTPAFVPRPRRKRRDRLVGLVCGCFFLFSYRWKPTNSRLCTLLLSLNVTLCLFLSVSLVFHADRWRQLTPLFGRKKTMKKREIAVSCFCRSASKKPTLFVHYLPPLDDDFRRKRCTVENLGNCGGSERSTRWWRPAGRRKKARVTTS